MTNFAKFVDPGWRAATLWCACDARAKGATKMVGKVCLLDDGTALLIVARREEQELPEQLRAPSLSYVRDGERWTPQVTPGRRPSMLRSEVFTVEGAHPSYAAVDGRVVVAYCEAHRGTADVLVEEVRRALNDVARTRRPAKVTVHPSAQRSS